MGLFLYMKKRIEDREYRGDLRWPWPAAAGNRISVSGQRLKSGPQKWEHWILTTRPVVSDKTMALRFAEKDSHKRWKVVKHVKCLLGGKRVAVDGHVSRRRESPSFTWSAPLTGSIYSAFHQSFCFAWFWVHSWRTLSRSPHVCTHPAQDGLQARGWWAGSCHSPLWTSNDLLVQKVSLTLRMRKTWSLSFHLCRAQLLLLFIFGVSVHRWQTPAVQAGAHLSPASEVHNLRDEYNSIMIKKNRKVICDIISFWVGRYKFSRILIYILMSCFFFFLGSILLEEFWDKSYSYYIFGASF